jgi:hypothetical protein
MVNKLATGESEGKKPVPEKSANPKAPASSKADKTQSFNQTTIEALQDARDDKNLTRYADEDDLFKKLESTFVGSLRRARIFGW